MNIAYNMDCSQISLFVNDALRRQVHSKRR